MRLRTLVVLTALMSLVPAQAHAGGKGWLAWLEELSGPGYFFGGMASFDFCPGDPHCEKMRAATRSRPERFPKSVVFTGGFLTSQNRPRFKDVPPNPDAAGSNREPVHAIPLYVTLQYRIHRSLDIGPGAGAIFFDGKDVKDHGRLVLIPVSVSWKPALLKSGNAGWVRGFSVDFQALYLTQGFDGESFGNSASTYKSGPQLQGMIGVSYDFGEGIGGRVKK